MPLIARYIAVATLALSTIAPSAAYARLERAQPDTDASPIAVSAASLTLTFSAQVDLGMSKIRLTDSRGDEVSIQKPRLTDGGTEVDIPLTGPLAPGAYKIRWQATSIDGRRSEGSYRFNVAPQTDDRQPQSAENGAR
jgi:copper resistance protein C